MARRTGVFAALGALLTGCSATGALDALVPGDSYRGREGVAYGPLARHRLDVFQPLQPTRDAPLVLFFYGGNWSSGERAMYRFVGEALASQGAVALVADYRLSPEVGWRQILQDCALAARWAWDHAAELGAAQHRIFLMGHSAGAYNAAMLALDARWLAAQGLAPQRLAGWIGIAGPYDFLPIGNRATQVAFGWPQTPADSQPVRHVSGQAPRTLLLAAARDTTVDPRRGTVNLGQRLAAAGVPVQVRLFENVNHATVLGAIARPLRFLAPVLDEVLGFIGVPRG
ncbi:alpha/beta hydrolase [Ramlibacter tataouinensis]|uniref:Esterase-like protein n=1 Tax=Ramlibacter tataouinensis (strain ATCC BAA-407 / DSM 14655 / LMG 21543 / TTB310) TaxID=365046 RepID=F5Y231_RAMTT|nr:alpha/beta hydrolase [Ramlibacter tataouinensis]AEG94799.1 esterase-like protein [Ramlibacter tataouinensis TTB310]